MAIHEGNEFFAMIFILQVCQFVEDHILQALQWLLCQLQIDPDLSRFRIAGSPLGRHVLGLPCAAMQFRPTLPYGQQSLNLCLQLIPIPLIDECLPLLSGAFLANGQNRLVPGKGKSISLIALKGA